MSKCNGTKNDIKWCNDAAMWSKQDTDWKPLYEGYEGDETKIRCGMSGQQIRAAEEKDLLTYHCLNRWDEDPFEAAFKNKSKVDEWLDAVNTSCFIGFVESDSLHCMGQNAGQCIRYPCKFLILIAFSCQFAWHYTPFFKTRYSNRGLT